MKGKSENTQFITDTIQISSSMVNA